ncbi:MAG: PhoH family protein, partial [Lentisphaeria bacterium]
IFVFDTNVLLHDADCLFEFADNHIVLILQVLEELDTFKGKPGDLGLNARKVARILDEARKRGRLSDGVSIGDEGGIISVIDTPTSVDFPSSLKDSVDNALLETAFTFAKKNNTILVTKDINLRIKADALGIFAEDYFADKRTCVYDGYSSMSLTHEQIESLKFTTRLRITNGEMKINEYYSITEEGNDKSEVLLARVMHPDQIMLVEWCNNPIIGVKPRNVEQHFLMDALLDENIKLVTIHGKAGTGKTLLSIAAALYKTYVDYAYVKIKLMRPVIPVDKGIGFLPGSLEEKMQPWMAPIYNNLEFLKQADRKTGRSVLPITFDEGDIMEIAPLSYIRGQSVSNSIMIIDEAQNLSPLEIKTIVTRAGEGTKLIFTGDIEQIDNPYLTKFDNGLTYLASKFRNHRLHCHITLSKGERSELAEIASNIL